jgi:hypothetical protein
MLDAMHAVIDREQIDLAAIANVLFGGIYYLVLRSRTVDTFSGIDLHTEEGWQRIERAICQMLDVLVNT